ncbi:MAG: tRNA pseudouridine(55) synthase TruB [Isosphaeraceae bacterium]|nr:tRNA pseudouridine(55) synthase TruB [Isosphaeraceae bacterium]
MGQGLSAPLCGVLNVNKPPGVTSRDVVNQVARLVRKTKVGHAGTLDPLASGVLVVCVGAATRLIEYVQRMPKTYRTVIRLGAQSDTLDADGRIEEVACPHEPTETELRAALDTQVGTITQRPPAFSALKVDGRRAYDLARAGQAVELAPRPVTIDRIDLLAYAWPRLELEIACGSGTYIRAIARDVGVALGCGGLVEVLTRTRIGAFTIDEALDPDVLSAQSLLIELRPPQEAVAGLPRVQLSTEHVAAVAQGRAVPLRELAAGLAGSGEVALIGPDGALVAVGECRPGLESVHPTRVLVR